MTLRRTSQRSCAGHARCVAILSMTVLLASSLVLVVAPQTIAGAPCTEITGSAASSFALSEPGSYDVGRAKFSFQDAGRWNRRIRLTVWYPAVLSGDPPERTPPFCPNCAPDRSDAPYPLILSSTKVASIFAPYLVKHGFSWVSVDGIDTYDQMGTQMFDQPLDILFALEMAGSGALEGFEGMIDADHAGAMGYSFDGYNSLALSGARIDPDFYLTLCSRSDASYAVAESAFSCTPAASWGEFAAQAGEAITTSEDGLWQPMTDERIQAVMPLAGEGWWLFGPRGLAAVNRPTLMIAGTQDGLYPENAEIFSHIGTPDRTLISFVGSDHMMVYDQKMIARMAHFAVAFFGYHLRECADSAWYFSEEFVALHDDLAWGVYTGE